MKPKTLAILGGAAVVLGGIAYLTSREPGSSVPDIVGKPVLETLDVNAVSKVLVRTATGTTTVSRIDQKWVLADRFNYPADFAKVRSALIALSELKVGQLVKVSDARRKTLKMSAPATGNADSGTMVELVGTDGNTLASLLVGDTRERKSETPSPYGGGMPDGRYVSTDKGETVFLVTAALSELSAKATDWLDTEICNVASTDVTEVKVTGPDRATLHFTRKDGGSLELAGLAENEELDTSKMYGVESALSYLRMADVADPALTDAVTGLDKPVVFTGTTKKGEIYTLKLGKTPEGGTQRYLRMAVALTPAEPDTPAADTEQSEEQKKQAAEEAEKKAKERQELEASVAKLDAALSPWIFLVESYKADNLTITRDKVVKEKEEAPPATPAPAEPTPAPVKVETTPVEMKPAPAKVTPKPAPAKVTPKPAPVKAAPAPAPVKAEAKPAPTPVKVTPKPAPAPAKVTPKPEPAKATPAPAPVKVEAKAAPAPAKVTPAPAPAKVTPKPAPAPAKPTPAPAKPTQPKTD